MRGIRNLAVLGVLGVAALGAGCGDSKDDSSSAAPQAGASADGAGTSTVQAGTAGAIPDVNGKRVILVSCATSNAYCGSFNRVIKEQLQAKGAKVTVYENAFDPAKQSSDLEQAISQRPDLIILEAAAGSKAAVPAIRKAVAQKVPLLNVDGRADPSVADIIPLQVLTENTELGTYAAQNLVEGMKKAGFAKGNVIAITGTRGALIVDDRMKAFNAVLAQHPEYKLVATEDGNWDPAKSGQIASQLFAKFRSQGGIQGAYGMADYQAVPISAAAKQAGLKVGPDAKGIIITGSNCTKAGVEAVKSGDIYGDATQAPTTIARETAAWSAKLLAGQKVPKVVEMKEQRITADNAQQFEADCSGAG